MAKLDTANIEVQAEHSAISYLKGEIDRSKADIQQLTIGSINAKKDFFSKTISASQLVSLQKEIEVEIKQKTSELGDFEKALSAHHQRNLSDLLQHERIMHIQSLHHCRKQIAYAQVELLANDAVGLANTPLKQMALLLLSPQWAEDEPAAIYKKLGLEICKALFGDKGPLDAKLPSIADAIQQINEFFTGEPA